VNSGKKFSLTTYFFALIALALAIGLIILAVWTEIALQYLENVLTNTDALLGVGIAGVILLLLAGRTLWAGLRTSETFQHTLIKNGEMGEIHISLEAINNLIIKSAQAVRGVKEVKPRIKSLPEGVAVLLVVVINPDLDIPKVTTELQDNVAQYLQEYGGIEVLEVKVLVENVKSQTKTSRVD
jgi:uncharacterized alkaline shock family protein YloU